VYDSPVRRMRARTSRLKPRCRVNAYHLLDRWRPPPSDGHTAYEMIRAARGSDPLRSARVPAGAGRSKLGAGQAPDLKSAGRGRSRSTGARGRAAGGPAGGNAIVGGRAGMAELADASVSKTDARKGVRVRLPVSAPCGSYSEAPVVWSKPQPCRFGTLMVESGRTGGASPATTSRPSVARSSRLAAINPARTAALRLKSGQIGTAQRRIMRTPRQPSPRRGASPRPDSRLPLPGRAGTARRARRPRWRLRRTPASRPPCRWRRRRSLS
jgi:hypothetical protein